MTAAATEIRDEVAIFGCRAVDLDPKGHERIIDAKGSRRDLLGRRQDRLEDRHLFDRLVGRDDDHHLVLGAVDRQGGEGDRGGCVPTERFEEELGVRRLLAGQCLVAAIRDDRDVIGETRQAATDAWSSVPCASKGRNGFGRSGRLSGWSRVPPPPAITTAYIAVQSTGRGAAAVPGAAEGQTAWAGSGCGMPASAERIAALSVRSQGRSRSGRPKWPYAAVWR